MMVRRNCAAAMYVSRRDPHAFRNSIVVEGINCWLGICPMSNSKRCFGGLVEVLTKAQPFSITTVLRSSPSIGTVFITHSLVRRDRYFSAGMLITTAPITSPRLKLRFGLSGSELWQPIQACATTTSA